MTDIYVFIQFRWGKSEKLLKTHEKSSIITIVHKTTRELNVFRLDTTDARILMELDQLYKRVRRPHKERLAFLRQYPDLIEQRDDLVLEEITLLNQTGEYEKAKALLDAHSFHPWEGVREKYLPNIN